MIRFLGSLLFVSLITSVHAVPETGGRPFARIVSLAPNITETLFRLGLGESVVGVTDFCDYPPEAARKRRVGGFINPDIETIINLRPDLVVATRDGNRRETVEQLRRLGFRVEVIDTRSLADVFRYILDLGRLTGAGERADGIVREMEKIKQDIAARVAGRPRPRVMFVYTREPLILAGAGSYADDLIGIAGGDNIAADSRERYPRFDLESVLARRPEVIIMSNMEGAYRSGEDLTEMWSEWTVMPAVRNGRITALDPNLVDRPGPRLIEGLKQIARAIHPDLFAGD